MCWAYRQAMAATVWDSTSLSTKFGLRGFGRSSLVLYLEGMTNDTTYLHGAHSLDTTSNACILCLPKGSSLPAICLQACTDRLLFAIH